MTELVLTERDGPIAVVTLNRPDALNALSDALMEQLVSTLTELDRDDEVRCVVLAGNDKAFAAGADIAELARSSAIDLYYQRRIERWDAIRGLWTPLVAAVSGYCLGGGCELALACDLRYASTTAKLGQPEVNLGIFPGWGGTQRLARVCGLGVAKDLILTGRVVDAKEARRIGLVNDVFEPGELMKTTLKIAQLIASKGPLALAEAKAAINHSLQGDYVESLEAEAEGFGQLFSTMDAREGMAAFVEKREPDFKGR